MYPNWFEMGAVKNFENYLKPIDLQEPINCLQIGTYTGDASVWLAENFLNKTDPASTLVDVDTWEGSEEPEHENLSWMGIEETYDFRVSKYPNITKIKSTSDNFFNSLNSSDKFDFIYIDGDHTAPQVLADGLNAFKHLSVDGILAFDDLTWKSGKGTLYDPEAAISAIVTMYKDFITVFCVNAQLWLIKNSDPDIFMKASTEYSG